MLTEVSAHRRHQAVSSCHGCPRACVNLCGNLQEPHTRPIYSLKFIYHTQFAWKQNLLPPLSSQALLPRLYFIVRKRNPFSYIVAETAHQHIYIMKLLLCFSLPGLSGA